MREAFVQWIEQASPFNGLLACAVRGMDGAVAARSWAPEYQESSLENVLRCVADLFQVIQHNRIAPGRVRWIYGNALLHCERRSDGACFGVFTTRGGEGELDPESLEQLFVEFRSVGVVEA